MAIWGSQEKYSANWIFSSVTACRTVLMKWDSKEFILVINRKSRIIMKDALAILKKIEKIKEKVPNALVALETNAPVCSKSIKFLEEKDVDVLKRI